MSKTNKSVEAAANIIAGVLNDDVGRIASISGALPAQATTPVKFSQKTGYVVMTVTLSADPLRGSCAIYTVQVTPGAGVASFPGGSPLLRAPGPTFNLHTPAGSTCDVWVVTSDKFYNPASPTSGNAFYAGRFLNTTGVITTGVNS